MDLEKMENLWAQHNKKLEQNLKLNEAMLREAKLEKAKKELQAPYFSELISSILTAFFVIYLLLLSVSLIEEIKFSLPGIIAAACASMLIYFAIVRMRKMKQLDERGTSVLELQKHFYALQDYRTQMGRWEILLGAILILTIWPIILWTGFKIDLYENGQLMVATFLLCALVGISVGIWYERFYRRKMGNTEILLEEIRELEKE
ncbi:MAG: hypothetical protein AAFR87_09015 [Bacteroidota bacterium]